MKLVACSFAGGAAQRQRLGTGETGDVSLQAQIELVEFRHE